MKKYVIGSLVFFCTLLSENAMAQAKSYSFEITKSGHGKETIIFIPGFASSGAVWNETKSKFEKDHTCITLTMAGFAGVKPQSNPTFSGWKNEIAAYIKDHKIDKPVLVGHSMGGTLAMAIASDYPELIKKIVVVDGLPCLPALMNPDFKVKENNDCSEITKQMAGFNAEQFLQMQKTSIRQLMENPEMQETVVSWSLKSDRKTFGEMYCDFSNTDLRTSIQSITCPVLVLLESYFANIKPAIADQFKNLKTADLQYAEKGLHFIMYDDKDWYFNQLNTFIAGK